jgi:DNA-binding FadR family transcriptional regulator
MSPASVNPGRNDVGSLDAVFAPVVSQTAFEETVERLGTAIKLGLLAPGSRLPPERDLCAMLGIARSTLRQALTALAQSGHLHAVRGRGGGTFISESQPPLAAPTPDLVAGMREACDMRLATDLGVVVLACQRAEPAALEPLRDLVGQMDDLLDDFPAYRSLDVRFHIGLADAAGSQRLINAATEAQGAMSDLILHIPHPPEVLAWSNAQHARILDAVDQQDATRAASLVVEHLQGTERILSGLLPPS